MKFDTPNPEMDPSLGVQIFWGHGCHGPAEGSWGSAEREEKAGWGLTSAPNTSEACTGHSSLERSKG